MRQQFGNRRGRLLNDIYIMQSRDDGCVHLRPTDRDEFIRKGYLRDGVDFEVRPYSEKGPAP